MARGLGRSDWHLFKVEQLSPLGKAHNVVHEHPPSSALLRLLGVV
jgi:hypothetical protein